VLRNQIFISYSHKDRRWLEDLRTSLKPYLRGSSILAWDDTMIKAGDDWREKINQALASARVAVLLMSPDFLASDFIYMKELPYLMEADSYKKIRVFAVAVRPCAWKTAPLESKKWANNPEKPLSIIGKPERDRELDRISQEITSYLATQAFYPPNDFVAPHVETVKIVSQSAREELNVLREFLHDPRIQMKVETFKASFMTSYRSIDRLAYYKGLHDLLHTLQIRCYNYLTYLIPDIRKAPDDLSVWGPVIGAEIALQKVSSGFIKAAGQTSRGCTEPFWLPKLIQDLKVLSQAIEQNNVEEIDIAIKPIYRVLATETSNINARLVGVAEGLPLKELKESLATVRDCIHAMGVNPTAFERLADGVQAIIKLSKSLDMMIASHNRWQYIDNHLRRIERNISSDFSELENSWDELKMLAETQCDGCEEEWAQSLKRDIAKLDQALSDRKADRIRYWFERFKSKANERFYEVDVDLKDLCDQLLKVCERLTTIWEVVR
jgi:hypothetical protein